MKAILSDVHSNLEALQAVLQDIALHNVETIYCLGDLVGYGPNPRECLDLAMHWPVVLRGNHDQATRYDPEGFGLSARQSILWTKAQLDAPVPDADASSRRWQFLERLPLLHHEGDFLFVHGSPRNTLNEYVFPEDIDNGPKMSRVFEAMDRYCFGGHTHYPGVFTEDRRFLSPEDVGSVYHLDGRKTLCNVGSVGQPRDGDWRACYALLDSDTIRFRRVEYDVEATVRHIHATEELANFLGDRLRDGR